jgi:AcrR family transcriptional regulator
MTSGKTQDTAEVPHTGTGAGRQALSAANDGLRSRVRQELVGEILSIAKHHLATHGSSGLSLRAIARDLGMVSSAIYRYFPSRDDLITALILDAFENLADAVEAGEAKPKRNDLRARWIGAARALRRWAVDNRHEYALIYGTPIPGYIAPQETIAPVLRATKCLVDILRDGVANGEFMSKPRALNAASRKALDPVLQRFPDIPADVLASGLAAWMALFGMIGFELFGHLNNVIDSPEVFFEHEVVRLFHTF